ncbi:hypothetical protein [Frankia sp. AgB32]|uniref:hypothetical protein n=1 Tax=Frankia sp. AgB32 TaxID=631119 RepID=UPI002010A072|nr:hypothetical protein [Frankia sp. AgB32]MCK9897382.1 hypothetical protein [Frankia sp. AgB32]
MKFRPLGVALVAGGGVALAALPASPAAALNDDQPLISDNAYPPVSCAGATGTGTVSKSVVLAGESVVFSGCGFVPGTAVSIEVNGVPRTTTIAGHSGAFSVPLNFPTAGQQHLSASGRGLLTTGTTAVGPGTGRPPVKDAPILGDDTGGGLFDDKDGHGGGLFDDKDGHGGGLFDDKDGHGGGGRYDGEDAPVLLPAPGTAAAPVTTPAGPATGGVAAPGTGVVPPAPGTAPAPAPVGPVVPPINIGLAASLDPAASWRPTTRIVTANVLVIGIDEDGIHGLPFDPRWIPNFIGSFLDKDKDHDKDHDKDGHGGGGVGNCFGNVGGDRDGKDGKDNWGDKNGTKDAQASELSDKDGKDGKDFADKDGKDGKDFADKDHKDGVDGNGVPCVVAGVGVGVVGGGGGVGAGAAAPGGGALPFTGVETGALASIAVALLGGGALLRVAARRRRIVGATPATVTRTEA